MRTPRGTKIKVKVNDLPKDSHVKIKVSCDICGKVVTPTYQAYNSKIEKYGDYVCRHCENAHQKKTVMEKYGVDNISQIDSVKQKKVLVSFERYGTENVAQSSDVIKKIQETNIQKYGRSSFVGTPEYA